MEVRLGKSLGAVVEWRLSYGAITKGQREQLRKLAENGEKVALLDEVPDVPDGAGEIVDAFFTLARAVPGGEPIGIGTMRDYVGLFGADVGVLRGAREFVEMMQELDATRLEWWEKNGERISRDQEKRKRRTQSKAHKALNNQGK